MEPDYYETYVLPLITAADKLQMVKWMQQKGLLRESEECHTCKEVLNLQQSTRNLDGFNWKCSNCIIVPNLASYNIRRESLFWGLGFEGKLPKCLQIMHIFSEGESIEMACEKIPEVTYEDCKEMFFRLSTVCKMYLKENMIRIGGNELIVEVGESKMSLLNDEGIKDTLLVLKLIDTSYEDICIGYMEVVPDWEDSTLLPLLDAVVVPGSILCLNESEIPNDLKNSNFSTQVHPLINESEPRNVDHDKNADILALYWENFKCPYDKLEGCSTEMKLCYWWQMMWRDRFSCNAYFNLCTHIAQTFEKSAFDEYKLLP